MAGRTRSPGLSALRIDSGTSEDDLRAVVFVVSTSKKGRAHSGQNQIGYVNESAFGSSTKDSERSSYPLVASFGRGAPCCFVDQQTPRR